MALFLVLGSVISLQFGAAFASQLFGQVGAPGATALRLGVAAILLALVRRPKFRQESLVLGMTLAGMNGTFYLAIERIPLGVAVTIEFLGPLGVALAMSRRPKDFLWALLALSGVIALGLKEHAQHLDLVGVALALLAAAFWACYVIAGSRLAATPGSGGLAAASMIAAALTFPYGLASGGLALFDPKVLLLGLVVALLASAIPYTLELRALKTLPPKTFGVVLALEPAAAALAGALLLHQHLSPVSLGAIALVIIAGVGAAVTARPTPSAPAGTPAVRDEIPALPVPR
ncbi:DMT transporter permease [Lentzea sp. NBRC 105346]|uniref:EamA family transporter n=1 Tax=Lentzea sp. NBRC 105346 TaxID=3032205 RepID=UPI00249FF699|nr:EamA family transporter [Lentzea sp. NBRC 105346]GLZ28958.1 DMT transporter permease [Lentzea sp. NBRC 105346]